MSSWFGDYAHVISRESDPMDAQVGSAPQQVGMAARGLCEAILRCALEDLHRKRKLRVAAEAWIFSDEVGHPFTFVELCQALGYDVSAVRAQVRQTLPPLGLAQPRQLPSRQCASSHCVVVFTPHSHWQRFCDRKCQRRNEQRKNGPLRRQLKKRVRADLQMTRLRTRIAQDAFSAERDTIQHVKTFDASEVNIVRMS